MKKLMFAAVAIAAGAVFAADGDITSANVVGYQKNVVTNGGQGVGVTFKNVGGTGTMADLKITGYGDEYADNGIYAQKVDFAGCQSGDLMYWVDYSEEDEESGEETTWYGWLDGDTWEIPYGDVPLAAGEGVWLTLDVDCYVQSSGEVIGETLPVAVQGQVGGYLQICPNPTPVVVTLGQVELSGYGDEYADNGIYAQKVDGAGLQLGDLMYWVDYSEVDEESGEETTWHGWLDGDTWEISYDGVTLNPGESIHLSSDTDCYINWPSPLADDK